MRLFIATTFPQDVLRLLNDRIVLVRPKLPPASWVRPETQHLTFAFLGEQPESLVDRLSPLLTARLAKVARFDATLRGCGFFPNHRHARVGWVGAEPEERFGPDLAVLAGLIADGSLKPRIAEYSWRDLSRIGPLLRDRQIPGKAVFHTEQR